MDIKAIDHYGRLAPPVRFADTINVTLKLGRPLVRRLAKNVRPVAGNLTEPWSLSGAWRTLSTLHPRRGMTAGREEEIAPLMRRWEQVKAGDGAVVLIGGEPGNREIAPRAAAHRVAEARRIVANQSSRSNGGLTTSD